MISKTVLIADVKLPVIEYRGQRVVTLKMVDQVHQKTSGQAKTQFNRNRQYMKEGEDFYLVDYSEKYLFDTFDIEIPPRGLTVLTESGYLLLVKSFTDGLAWQIQRLLVNAYFRKQNIKMQTDLTTETKRELINKYQVATYIIQFTFKIALFIGVHANQARQFAINRAFKETGIDYSELLTLVKQTATTTSLQLDDETKPRIPSQLGFLVNKPATRINNDLQNQGLQWRDHDGQWRPTEQGKKYCADTPHRTCRGHHPLFWYPKVLEVLYPHIQLKKKIS